MELKYFRVQVIGVKSAGFILCEEQAVVRLCNVDNSERQMKKMRFFIGLGKYIQTLPVKQSNFSSITSASYRSFYQVENCLHSGFVVGKKGKSRFT